MEQAGFTEDGVRERVLTGRGLLARAPRPRLCANPPRVGGIRALA